MNFFFAIESLDSYYHLGEGGREGGREGEREGGREGGRERVKLGPHVIIQLNPKRLY